MYSTRHLWAWSFWRKMTSVCWKKSKKSWIWAILEICLLLADKFNKSLNILAAHHSMFWSTLNIAVIVILFLQVENLLLWLCWSYWVCLMSLHVRYNLLFLVEHATQILNRNVFTFKFLKLLKTDTIVLAIIIFDE